MFHVAAQMEQHESLELYNSAASYGAACLSAPYGAAQRRAIPDPVRVRAKPGGLLRRRRTGSRSECRPGRPRPEPLPAFLPASYLGRGGTERRLPVRRSLPFPALCVVDANNIRRC